eukprot:gb/GECG01006125.1/.p1 GENE.gb/GECG01006125.1/~~gb/GECG01006125.1/.p1  ORF type:complete len:828 (+),score=76.02 gb/GECG01006125.1/:1-2484(+)
MSGLLLEEDEGAQCDIQPGHVAYMCFASTLVMLQTPATGIAQAGIIRRKNVLSILMQTITGMVVGSVLWFVVGYTLVWGPSLGGIIGHPTKGAFMLNVPVDTCVSAAPHIPGILFAAFQMMFALMTPVLVTGAWAEKLTFEAFLLFLVIWPFAVYYPLAHWIWNGQGWLKSMGVLDFAGGMVIHTSSGVAGLVVAIMLARRRKIEELVDSHHNLPLMFIGAIFIFAGWYSFNGASAYAANGQSAQALMSTHISGCTGGICWLIMSWWLDHDPAPVDVAAAESEGEFEDSDAMSSILDSSDKHTQRVAPTKKPQRRKHQRRWHMKEIINGVLAGLASITAGSGYVAPQAAFFIGIGAAFTSYFTIYLLKKYRVDDVLDVMALQGTPGIWGSFAVGWAARSIKDFDLGERSAVFYGGGFRLLGVQCLAIVVTVVWAAFWTWVIFKCMSIFMGIEVDSDVEAKGLDVHQIGEHAYDLDEFGHPVYTTSADESLLAARLRDACAMGNLSEVKWLLRIGGDPSKPDYDHKQALHWAVESGQLRICKAILADSSVDINATDRWGDTPLVEAIARGYEDIAQYLQGMGATLPADEEGIYCLCAASHNGDINEIRHLIRRGIPVNSSDYDRRTALHIAASEGHLDVCRFLLSAGADVLAVDMRGDSPVDNAKYYGHKEIYELLLEARPVGPTRTRARTRSSFTREREEDIAPIPPPPRSRTIDTEQTAIKPTPPWRAALSTVNSLPDEHTPDSGVKTPLLRGSVGDSSNTNTSTQQLLVTAAGEGDLSEVKRLIRKGADPTATSYGKCTDYPPMCLNAYLGSDCRWTNSSPPCGV